MEHLPRNEGADAASTSEISASILPLVSAELRKARSMLWTCPSTRPRSLRHACASSYRPVVPVVPVATAVLDLANTIVLVTEQVRDRHHFPPSLFERNAVALAAQQRRDAEWESGTGGEAAAEARKLALAKLVAAAFKGKGKGAGGSDGSGQSAQDIVNEFASGNKVSPTSEHNKNPALSFFFSATPQASDGAFARAAKIAHDGDGSSAAGGSKPMTKVPPRHCIQNVLHLLSLSNRKTATLQQQRTAKRRDYWKCSGSRMSSRLKSTSCSSYRSPPQHHPRSVH